jgi:hypothetical protein
LTYNIFISYAGGDNDLAQLLYDSLEKIKQFRPYKAENYLSFEEGFKQRIQNEIINSHFVILLMTENGKSSQFVNQELGYALAVKFYNKAVVKAKLDPNRDIPIIIPVSQRGVELKGFITKDSDDILFLENYSSLRHCIADIIGSLRNTIPNGLADKTLTIKVTCSGCDKNGLPFEYEGYLPRHEVIRKHIQDNVPLKSKCPKCEFVNIIDARTLITSNFVTPRLQKEINFEVKPVSR